MVIAIAVAAAIYAITGGFSTALANPPHKKPPSVSANTTMSTIPTIPSTSIVSSTTATSPTTTTLATTTTTHAPTTTTTTVAPTTTTPPVTIPPSQILVEVYNGSGQPGQATTVAAALREAGFGINGTANAATFDYTASKIIYAPGSATAAATVGAHITGAYILAVDRTLPAGVVDLIVGTDYSGVRA